LLGSLTHWVAYSIWKDNYSGTSAMSTPIEFQYLHTARLSLRILTAKECAYFFEHCSEEVIRKELGLTTDAAYDKKVNWFKKGFSVHQKPFVKFQLIDRSTDEIIGACGFHNWFEEHKRSEFGYDLYREEHKRKGFMTEAATRIIAYGFETLGLNRIEACVGPSNIASQKVLQKLNFKEEGLLREHFYRDGIFHDSIIFSLLKTDYDSQMP
jgi:[ribosomal protein S5]-alanine N-acetyltransferase